MYETPADIALSHYDFYRLQNAGVLRAELAESVAEPHTVTVIEWAEVVADVLPLDTLKITIRTRADDSRLMEFSAGGKRSQQIEERLT